MSTATVRPTPAPWTIAADELSGRPCVRHNGIVTAFIDTPNTIGYTKEQDIARQRAQDAANVRLIVAAPAMLDALQRIATDPANARETALAAIATATGKT